MQQSIRVNTLGSLDVRKCDGLAATAVLKQPKRVAILAYLAVARSNGFHRRDTLLGLFWPEHDTSHARMSLRQALSGLRRDLGSDVIITRGSEDVRLKSDGCVCDAREFGAALSADDWERAVDLYKGPFLHGLYVSSAPGFEQWVEAERDRLARAYAEAVEHLAAQAEDPAEAVRRWRQLADHDPYSSHVTLELMKALVAAGDRAAAIHVEVKHSSLLNTDLEAAQDPEVTEFARTLRGEPTDRPEAVPTHVLPFTTPRASPRQPSMRVRAAMLALVALVAILGTPLRSVITGLIDGQEESAAAPPAWDAMFTALALSDNPRWITTMGDSMLVFSVGPGTLLTFDGTNLNSILVKGFGDLFADDHTRIELEFPALDLAAAEGPVFRGPVLTSGESTVDTWWTEPRIPEWMRTALSSVAEMPDGSARDGQPDCVVVQLGRGAKVFDQCGVVDAGSPPTIVLFDKAGNLKRIIH